MDHPELYLNCSCSSLDHMVRFSEMDGVVYVEVTLSPLSFWRRVKAALRYVFGNNCRYVTCAEVVLNEADMARLREWLEEVTE